MGLFFKNLIESGPEPLWGPGHVLSQYFNIAVSQLVAALNFKSYRKNH